MIFKIDDRVFENVAVVSLTRNVSIKSGGNTGTFLSGRQYYDTQKSYLSYNMVLNASTLSPNDYDSLFEILSAPEETHKFEIIYGQTMRVFEGHVSQVSDKCLKKLQDKTLWGNLSIQFTSVEAL